MDIFSSPQAWNNEPVDRTVVYNSADFTSVSPHRCHRSGISVVGSQQRKCPAFDKASPVTLATLLLPASAERLIEPAEASVFVAPRRGQRQFGAVK